MRSVLHYCLHRENQSLPFLMPSWIRLSVVLLPCLLLVVVVNQQLLVWQLLELLLLGSVCNPLFFFLAHSLYFFLVTSEVQENESKCFFSCYWLLHILIAKVLLYRYSNIFVTAPSPENLKTLFEFIRKGFESLEYKVRSSSYVLNDLYTYCWFMIL